MKLITTAALIAAAFVAGCGMTPQKTSEGHIRAEEGPAAPGSIPPPVQMAPVLPKPRAAPRPETYSVVVNNVRVQELLFSLARDAKLNVDIHPGVTGSVTLNAIDQTLPQLLARIAKQVDIRYEIDGPNLVVMRDTPYLRNYRIDYVNADRTMAMNSILSTQFGGGGGPAGGTSSAGASSTANTQIRSTNAFWTTLVDNVQKLLQETDKVIPVEGVPAPRPAPAPPAASQPGGQPPATTPAPEVRSAERVVTFREAASVIANRETGVIAVRATGRQHEKVQEFLDSVLASARRQVQIEATIAEVQLDNQYQRGIDWQRFRSGALSAGRSAFDTGNSGFEFNAISSGTPAGLTSNAFTLGYSLRSLNFAVALRLLESFGQVRVLSSPQISVLNNQSAVLRVTRDIIYFTLTPATTTVTATGGGTVQLPPTFTSTPNVAAEGFMMALVPQISENGTIVLNLRPTIRRRVADRPDPNPALQSLSISSTVPEFETREMESVLRLQSGSVAVLGGLMQDSYTNIQDNVPGLGGIPGFGVLFEQRRDDNKKTELVIFLRATVIREPSLDGDYRRFNSLLPDADFLRRPNPGKAEPYPEPGPR